MEYIRGEWCWRERRGRGKMVGKREGGEKMKRRAGRGNIHHCFK